MPEQNRETCFEVFVAGLSLEKVIGIYQVPRRYMQAVDAHEQKSE